MKPGLSCMACLMLRWLGALLGARRLGRLARRALAGVALEQAETWMFRRRTGHEASSFPTSDRAIYHGLLWMSAFGGKADIRLDPANVRL